MTSHTSALGISTPAALRNDMSKYGLYPIISTASLRTSSTLGRSSDIEGESLTIAGDMPLMLWAFGHDDTPYGWM